NNTAVNAGGDAVAIKPTAGESMPTAPLWGGLLAVLLIGGGFWVFRNRARQTVSPTE
ncbi:MAG: LPXTG cell wall anchor domain-containing protein, partial [Saccharothrix sp.]|nr:LPXTG cell wall anchor domain-containing protein [Saccharothrix sp.]